MKYSTSWKILIAGTAMAGLGIVGACAAGGGCIGAGAAAAETASQPNQLVTSQEFIVGNDRGGAEAGVARAQTYDSTHIRTAPQHRESQSGYHSQFGSPYDSYYGSYYYGSD